MNIMGVGSLIKAGSELVDSLFTSDEERADAKRKLAEMAQRGELEELANRAGIIMAEAKSEHTLTSAWRPITMLVFVAIVANNYILQPYLSLLWPAAPVLELPPQLWELLKLGLGGYVLGRSGEKMVKMWRAKD